MFGAYLPLIVALTSAHHQSHSEESNAVSTSNTECSEAKLIVQTPEPLPEVPVKESKEYQNYSRFYTNNKPSECQEHNLAIAALQAEVEQICQKAEAKECTHTKAAYQISRCQLEFEWLEQKINLYKSILIDSKTKTLKKEFELMGNFEIKNYSQYAKKLNAKDLVYELDESFDHCRMLSVKDKIIKTNWNIKLFQKHRNIDIDKHQLLTVPRKVANIWDEIAKSEKRSTYSYGNRHIYKMASYAEQKPRSSQVRTANYHAITEIVKPISMFLA